MTWNYRIVRYRNPEHGYGLHEVYYDQFSTIVNIGAAPASFVAHPEEGAAGIIKSLERALKEAQERPVLNESDLKLNEGA